ncbi:hypothetical protein VNO77_11883 [Canavalia gladiata]|uniref:Uncharacterized protein n=1 Tax=Canavalia gladiata TaxID=3824 RepID=A0AAN9M0T6_CANGL
MLCCVHCTDDYFLCCCSCRVLTNWKEPIIIITNWKHLYLNHIMLFPFVERNKPNIALIPLSKYVCHLTSLLKFLFLQFSLGPNQLDEAAC